MTDQEIRDALKVDPSPEFLARVRTRIAGEPAPSAWRWSWTVAAVGALAAVVLIAVVMSRPRRENPSAAEVAQTFSSSRATESEKAPAGPEGPARRQTEPARSAAVRRPGPLGPAEQRSAKAAQPTPDVAAHAIPVVSGFSRTLSREAEILIDPREGIALQRLLAGVRSGRVNLEPLARAVAQRANAFDDLQPPADIVIPLLPLTPAPGEGDRK